MVTLRDRRRCVQWTSALVAALLFPSVAQAADDWLIVPGVRVGPLSATMTEAELVAALPLGLVRRGVLELDEGDTICGTRVFADTQDEFFVEWRDTPTFDFPDFATDEACAALPPMTNPAVATITQGNWRTAKGLTIGLSIDDLDRLAGSPTIFSVCGCDFRGHVFEGTPEGVSLALDWPDDAEASIEVEPSHEDDYTISTLDVPPSVRHDFVVSTIRVVLADRP